MLHIICVQIPSRSRILRDQRLGKLSQGPSISPPATFLPVVILVHLIAQLAERLRQGRILWIIRLSLAFPSSQEEVPRPHSSVGLLRTSLRTSGKDRIVGHQKRDESPHVAVNMSYVRL